MCRLNALHCLIRTQTYGKMTFSNHHGLGTLTSNCYATVKVDYLSPNKQAFISHHDMKGDDDSTSNSTPSSSTSTSSNGSNHRQTVDRMKPTSLRTAERALYGVERLTESERMRLFLQCQLRSNDRLLIGRVGVSSRKLMSCNMVDPNTLLTDDLEHVQLESRYQNGLFMMERLFQWLLTESSLQRDVQYLLAFDSNCDEITIFVEPNDQNVDKL